MKKPDEEVPNAEEGFALRFHARPSTPVTITIPVDTLGDLEKVAGRRDMSADALMKLYIGQGLRQDLSKLFADRVLEKTEQVLARHLQSEEEVSAILKEIRVETVA